MLICWLGCRAQFRRYCGHLAERGLAEGFNSSRFNSSVSPPFRVSLHCNPSICSRPARIFRQQSVLLTCPSVIRLGCGFCGAKFSAVTHTNTNITTNNPLTKGPLVSYFYLVRVAVRFFSGVPHPHLLGVCCPDFSRSST